jgi:hypothetical protein
MPSRTVAFQVNKGAGTYPTSTGGFLVFGSDYAHSDFVSTMARFEFYTSDGQTRTAAPAIFIRMGGPFQTQLASSYNETTNMFGTPGSDFNKDSMLKLLKGGADSIYKQITGGLAGAAGFIGSAGLSGKAQYEFATRTALNTFKQLTYGGPSFRKFSLPFTMKPTSKQEAETMMKIIKTFRVSAAAKGAGSVGLNTTAASGADIVDLAGLQGEDLTNAQKANAEAQAASLSSEDLKNIGISDGGAGIEGISVSSNVISFGYPDMCLFQILIKKGNSSAESLSTVFESALCVIENVAIDYGSQNKMVFFDPGTGSNIYYPAEVTLTISLTETTLTTAGSVTEDHNQGTSTIF